MLGKIVTTLTFPTTAPPDAVWAALEATARWPEVQPDIICATIEPDGALTAGGTIRTWAKPGTAAVDMEYRVTEAEKPRRLVVESGGTPLHFRARTEYDIVADGTGARVTLTCKVEPVLWLHKITTAFARRWYTEQFATNLKSRMGPLLVLAERIAAERGAQT